MLTDELQLVEFSTAANSVTVGERAKGEGGGADVENCVMGDCMTSVHHLLSLGL